jgi:hypothetical protein
VPFGPVATVLALVVVAVLGRYVYDRNGGL